MYAPRVRLFNSNVPYFTLAVKCVQNFDVASNLYKLLLPAEPNLQPAELKRRVGASGNVLEVEEVQQFAFSDGTLTSRVHVSSASKSRDRSVWDVAQGYILYWHMVLILSVLIPAGTLDLDYEVDVVGMFVRPFLTVSRPVRRRAIIAPSLLISISRVHLGSGFIRLVWGFARSVHVHVQG